MKIKVIDKGDWEEVYVDGNLWMEGHTLLSRDWLDLIEQEFKEVETIYDYSYGKRD